MVPTGGEPCCWLADYIRGMPRLQFVTVFSDYGTFYSANLRDGKLDVNDLEQQMPFDNLVLDALNGTPLECDSSGLSYLMGISRCRIKSRQVHQGLVLSYLQAKSLTAPLSANNTFLSCQNWIALFPFCLSCFLNKVV